MGNHDPEVPTLSQTQREIMEIVWERGEVSALILNAVLNWEERETEAWVVDGIFKGAPIGDPWRSAKRSGKPLPKDQYLAFVLYGKTGPGGGNRHMESNAGSFDDLLKAFGGRTGRPVVNECDETPAGHLGWQTYYDKPEQSVDATFGESTRNWRCPTIRFAIEFLRVAGSVGQ